MNAPCPADATFRATDGARRIRAQALHAADPPTDASVSLRRLARDFLGRHGIECGIHSSEEPLWLDVGQAWLLTRIVDEALCNSGRHAEPSRVDIVVRRLDTRCELKIRDKGKGFDAAATARGAGLSAMRKWAAMLGGTFRLDSSPGRGTVVRLVFPLS